MTEVKLLQSGLEVCLHDDLGVHRLELSDGYPNDAFSSLLAIQFSAMHLLAAQLPPTVKADFPISYQMRSLIDRMYMHEVGKKPAINAGQFDFRQEDLTTDPQRAVISYSGGKDSLWNLWRAQEMFGKENVLAVHVHGLNGSQSHDEMKYSQRQSERLGFDLKTIRLKNGSDNKGYQVMRSRDMYMVGLIIPHALSFGAGNVFIEGFGEVAEREPFTGTEQNMKYFNTVLKSMGVPVEVKWKNMKEMDVVKEMFKNKPDWMRELCNCFSANCFKVYHKKQWAKRAPSFKMYDSQCGSCIKCRIINIGRILYDPGLEATQDDIRRYIRSTDAWLPSKLGKHDEMLVQSFFDSVREAAQRFDVPLKNF